MYDQAVHLVLTAAIFVLSVTLLFCLIRCIIGPRIADRLVGVNMIGTQVIIMIAFLALYLHEDGVVDVALIFAMLSFLSVVVFVKIFISLFREKLTGIPDIEEGMEEESDSEVDTAVLKETEEEFGISEENLKASKNTDASGKEEE